MLEKYLGIWKVGRYKYFNWQIQIYSEPLFKYLVSIYGVMSWIVLLVRYWILGCSQGGLT
jgi:hypothetical protein